MRRHDPQRATPRRTVALVLVLLLLLPGCRSVYDPPPAKGTQVTLVTKDDKPATYQDAIRYAEALMHAYRAAMIDDVLIGDRLAVVLIPLTAAALGLGISGVAGDPITAIGLASATGLGLGMWFQNRARREVFGVGAEAAHCVIVASKPLAVALVKEAQIRTARDRLLKAIEEVNQALAPFGPGLAFVAKAEEAVEDARGALRAADTALAQLALAGPMVVSATEGVRTRVVRAAVATAHEVRDLREHIAVAVQGSFRDIVGETAAAVKTAKSAMDATQSLQGRREGDAQNRAKLDDALRRLRLAAEGLRAELASLSLTGLERGFARCVEPFRELRAATRLQVLPDVVELEPGGKATVRITGGTPPYSIQRFPRRVRITYTGTLTADPADVEIAVGTGVAPGEYELIVRDSGTALGQTIIVDVAEAKAGRDASGAVADRAAMATGVLGELNKAEARAALRPAPTGPWRFVPSATQTVFQVEFREADTDVARQRLSAGLAELRKDGAAVTVQRATQAPNAVEVVVPHVLMKEFSALVTARQWPRPAP